ncbi:MAG: VOC family protein [Bradymonadaceae bacterium]|nr:VOC family protein [Lujinxingiaceae bacterium]
MTRLHHIALGARDVEAVAAFYRDLLGLVEQRRHLDGAGELRSIWLELGGDALLMVERTSALARHVDKIGAGAFLIAVAVSVGERRALELRLEAGGYAIESRSDFTSYSRDPEGNRIAISHFPECAPP